METNLSKFIEQLSRFKSVLVTGPQRSGTTIAAHILSAELKKRYVDENEIGIYDWVRALRLMSEEPSVIQAPGLMYFCTMFVRPEFALVIMRRSLNEIHSSEERIGWRTVYGGANVQAENDRYQATFGVTAIDGDIAAMKYDIWETRQKKTCSNAFELEYNDLKSHPLFNSERSHFGDRQWTS